MQNNDNLLNSQTGTNQSKDSYQFTVEIDKQTTVRFNTNKYHHFDHSYTVTLHKAQGQTVDWSIIVASKNMDAQATYVALTRHRNDTVLYYDSETFKGFKELQQSLSRVSNKDLVIDYEILILLWEVFIVKLWACETKSQIKNLSSLNMKIRAF